MTTGEKRDDGKIMGEDGTAFKHTPAESLTEKKKAEKLRLKIEERRNKRDIEKKLKKVQDLGESDSDGDDTQKWIERSRKIEKKKVWTYFDTKFDSSLTHVHLGTATGKRVTPT